MLDVVNSIQKSLPLTSVKRENELMTRIKGIALSILSVALVGGSIMTLVFSPIVIPLGAAIGGGVAAVVAGLYFGVEGVAALRKPCWEDPAYVARASRRAQRMSLQQIGKAYGWERVHKHNLLSQDQLKQKVNKEIDKKGISTFFKEAGSILFSMIQSEPWFKERLAFEMRDKTFFEMKRWKIEEGQPIVWLYKDLVKEELGNQLKEKGPGPFYTYHCLRGCFSELTHSNLLDPKGFTELFTILAKDKTVDEMVESYGWDIFESGILDIKGGLNDHH